METRMLLVEEDQRRHEKDCANRWSLLLRVMVLGGSGALTLLIGVAAWGLNKTWDAQQAQMQVLRQIQAEQTGH